MFKPLIALSLLIAAPALAAPAAPPAPTPRLGDAELWAVSDTRIASRQARIAFPLRIGALNAVQRAEFSHEGEGVDNGIQYRSSDNQVFGTVYIYYPGLSHGGLAAYTTDQAMRRNSQTEISGGEMRVVAAGGVERVAIRADYAGYRTGLASSSAFIKAGRWIVKFRISGPADRRAEVLAAMDALLAGVQFGAASPPRPAHPISVRGCDASTPVPAARLLAGDPAAVVGDALIGTFDGGANLLDDGASGRFGPNWCLSNRPGTGDTTFPIILRATGLGGAGPALDGRSVLAVLIGDSGTMLEQVEFDHGRRFVLLHHQVGRTALLGTYDRALSDAQALAILSGADDDGGRFRAVVRLTPGGNDAIEIQAPAPAPASPTT